MSRLGGYPIPYRDDKDYAIEYGEYLAQAAEDYMKVTPGDGESALEAIAAYRRLASAIYEFRKRVGRVVRDDDH